MANIPSLSVFCSYSHKDDRLRVEIKKELAVLMRQRLIEVWDDREITSGAEWAYEIDKNLERADIILFLVSRDFIASDYCMGIEVARAMEKHDLGLARIVPIIIRPCDWTSLPFARLQALPVGGKPLRPFTVIVDTRMTEVSSGLRKVVQELSARRSGGAVEAFRARGDEREASQTVLAYLCNRVEQDRQLRDAWKSHYGGEELFQRQRPFLCIVHGPVEEDHAGYLRRLAAYSLPQAEGATWDLSVFPCLLIRWPQECADRAAFDSSMWYNLAKSLNCPPEPRDIAARLYRLGETCVVWFELFSNSHDYGNRAALRSFFEFWSSWPDLVPRQKVVVILSVQYRANDRRGFPKSDNEFLAEISIRQRVTAVVLDELPPATGQDVKNWIQHPEVMRFCDVAAHADAWEAEIDEIFQQRSGMPMEQLAGTLNRMLNHYRRRQA